MKPNYLCLARSGDGLWLSWRCSAGAWKWVPMWSQHAVMAVWNPLVCLFKGHRVIGSLGNSECTHCMHCCRDTRKPCPACTILDAGGNLNGEGE
jgi:hypothetical protein